MLIQPVLLSIFALVIAAAPIAGQTMRRDPVSRDFLLTYTDNDGIEHTVVIAARDTPSHLADHERRTGLSGRRTGTRARILERLRGRRRGSQRLSLSLPDAMAGARKLH
ncbi:MAG TPA: hypothetical protein VF212_04385 [Longimicrobiales bacterium]